MYLRLTTLRCRDEATRTPDPYVPNVVRYQLRYIPISLPLQALFSEIACKGTAIFRNTCIKRRFFLIFMLTVVLTELGILVALADILLLRLVVSQVV